MHCSPQKVFVARFLRDELKKKATEQGLSHEVSSLQWEMLSQDLKAGLFRGTPHDVPLRVERVPEDNVAPGGTSAIIPL